MVGRSFKLRPFAIIKLVLDISAYTERLWPTVPPAMHQRWLRLAFIHYLVEPALLQPHIPADLEIDTFPDSSGTESAWIGIVAFAMRDIGLIGLPQIPTATNFLETNVRTYVHYRGRDPGVWFFSLDANSLLACAAARMSYGLPYFHSDMHELVTADHVDYTLRRYDEPQADARLQYDFSPEVRAAEPGTLDYFLIERYRLYSLLRGRLMTGMVRHSPYPVSTLSNLDLTTTLPEALGLPRSPICHVCFSPGVQVEVWGLEEVSEPMTL